MSQHMPEDLDYSLPDEMDRQVRDSLPDLFDGRYSSVLYVGANHLRQHFLDYFADKYEEIAVLEIHAKNVEYLMERYSANAKVSVIQGDVRNVQNIAGRFKKRFDVCFFYHGPEHLARHEVAGVLYDIESITDHLVVLGMPYGHYKQGPEYGNDHEQHLWDTYPRDMRRLGYKTHTLGKADDTLSNMIAWKSMGG